MEDTRPEYGKGAGLIMNSSYMPVGVISGIEGGSFPTAFNMHEFNIIDGGRNALVVTWEPRWYEDTESEWSGWVGDNGFQELDLITGDTKFEWSSLDHIPPQASMVQRLNSTSRYEAWDYL